MLLENRTMPMVLRSMTQLICFFLRAQKEYVQVLKLKYKHPLLYLP